MSQTPCICFLLRSRAGDNDGGAGHDADRGLYWTPGEARQRAASQPECTNGIDWRGSIPLVRTRSVRCQATRLSIIYRKRTGKRRHRHDQYHPLWLSVAWGNARSMERRTQFGRLTDNHDDKISLPQNSRIRSAFSRSKRGVKDARADRRG